MALNFTTLVAQVKAEVGKSSDTALLTDARVGLWVNNAQRAIIRSTPGLRDAHASDRTTWVTRHSKYSYALSDFSSGGIRGVAHIHRLRYIDETNKTWHALEPYVGGLDEWDSDYPNLNEYETTTYAITGIGAGAGGTFTIGTDITDLIAVGTRFKVEGSTNNDGEWEVASFAGTTVLTVPSTQTVAATADGTLKIGRGSGVPKFYVHRGNSVEIQPVPSLAYTDKELWLDYDILPEDESGSDSFLLKDFEDPIMFRAMGYAYVAMGEHSKSRDVFLLSEAFVQERVVGEVDYNEIDMMVNHGP